MHGCSGSACQYLSQSQSEVQAPSEQARAILVERSNLTASSRQIGYTRWLRLAKKYHNQSAFFFFPAKGEVILKKEPAKEEKLECTFWIPITDLLCSLSEHTLILLSHRSTVITYKLQANIHCYTSDVSTCLLEKPPLLDKTSQPQTTYPFSVLLQSLFWWIR